MLPTYKVYTYLYNMLAMKLTIKLSKMKNLKIENQKLLFKFLDAYGCRYTSSGLGIDSEMAYTKSNGGGAIATIVSGDIDLNDVFEDEPKIKGMVVTSEWAFNGFGNPQFPVNRITFDNL